MCFWSKQNTGIENIRPKYYYRMKKRKKFTCAKNGNFLVFTNFGEKHKIIENIAFLAKNSEIFHKNTFIHVVESQLTHKISNFDNLITFYDHFSLKLSYLQQTSYSVWHYKKYWPFSCWYDKFQVKLSLRSPVNVFWAWGGPMGA